MNTENNTPVPPAAGPIVGPVTANAILLEALDKIANTTALPCSEEQAYSWVETARHLASEALKEAGTAPPQTSAGPVWVKANIRTPNDDSPVHCKIDGMKRMGNFYANEFDIKFYVQGADYSIDADKFSGIEWLDESQSIAAQQLFTREQVSDAFHAGIISGLDSAADRPFISQDEYMAINYPKK